MGAAVAVPIAGDRPARSARGGLAGRVGAAHRHPRVRVHHAGGTRPAGHRGPLEHPHRCRRAGPVCRDASRTATEDPPWRPSARWPRPAWRWGRSPHRSCWRSPPSRACSSRPVRCCRCWRSCSGPRGDRSTVTCSSPGTRSRGCADARCSGPLSLAQLEQLAAGTTEATFADGAVIIRQGDVGDAFYLVTEGRVEVRQDGALLDTSRPGRVVRRAGAAPGCATDRDRHGHRRGDLLSHRGHHVRVCGVRRLRRAVPSRPTSWHVSCPRASAPAGRRRPRACATFA